MDGFIIKADESPADVKTAYEKINSEKENFGKYHKVIFHVHTPESYDYKLKKDWEPEEYQRKNTEEVLEEYFKLFSCKTPKNEKQKPTSIEIFDNDLKQFWAFMAMAKVIADHEIEIVVVADHNTIKGIRKLKKAIELLDKVSKLKVYPEIIGGVEISCADRVHVVGIFDYNNSESVERIEKWLKESLISVSDGSYKTSLETIETLNANGAITYIAHINTADIFKKEKFLSGGYRQRLLCLKELNTIGINDISKKEAAEKRLKDFRESKVNIVLDNDSHCLEELTKNIFWIKGEKKDFDMIAEAINDYDISVTLSEYNHFNSFIKGILVERKLNDPNTSFLIGHKKDINQPFVIKFSDALNCIIGGRGTGKSTLLKLLEFTLTLKCDKLIDLKHLCMHGNVWILFENNGAEYIVGMLMPYVGEGAWQSYYSKLIPGSNNLQARNQNRIRYEDAKLYALKNNLKIYKICKSKRKKANNYIEIKNVKEKKQQLRELFDTSYSVNDLVKIAGDNQLTSFLRDRLIDEEQLPKLSKEVKFKTLFGFRKFVQELPLILKQRENTVKGLLENFNKNNNTLIVEYQQSNEETINVLFENLLYNCINEWCEAGYALFNKYNITKEAVYDYLFNIALGKNKIDFFNEMLNSNKRNIIKRYSLLDFVNKCKKDGKEIITDKNQFEVIEQINNMIFSKYNVEHHLKKYCVDYLECIEQFNLKFDITSNSMNRNNKPNFKYVQQLSLGQKVVAMLSFILSISHINQDFRPLLIDQPEDNLDSQYIYENLVKQLRKMKEKRQIIIATHNATIVTNAMADKVCVMDSDGVHGWINTSGYPGTKRIKNAIINYLEGGAESFKHKEKIYRNVLDT